MHSLLYIVTENKSYNVQLVDILYNLYTLFLDMSLLGKLDLLLRYMFLVDTAFFDGRYGLSSVDMLYTTVDTFFVNTYNPHLSTIGVDTPASTILVSTMIASTTLMSSALVLDVSGIWMFDLLDLDILAFATSASSTGMIIAVVIDMFS